MKLKCTQKEFLKQKKKTVKSPLGVRESSKTGHSSWVLSHYWVIVTNKPEDFFTKSPHKEVTHLFVLHKMGKEIIISLNRHNLAWSKTPFDVGQTATNDYGSPRPVNETSAVYKPIHQRHAVTMTVGEMS